MEIYTSSQGNCNLRSHPNSRLMVVDVNTHPVSDWVCTQEDARSYLHVWELVKENMPIMWIIFLALTNSWSLIISHLVSPVRERHWLWQTPPVFMLVIFSGCVLKFLYTSHLLSWMKYFTFFFFPGNSASCISLKMTVSLLLQWSDKM